MQDRPLYVNTFNQIAIIAHRYRLLAMASLLLAAGDLTIYLM